MAAADPFQERFDVGSELIAEAGAVANGFFESLGTLTVERKGTQDVVSEADVAVERLIRDRLGERFPGDAFLGEETGRGDVEGAEGIWIVDPIDGTLPLVSGLTSWCVSVGYAHRGQLQMGFLAAPARDELFIGWRGHGATLNGEPIEVSRSTSIDDGLLCIGMSPRIGADDILPIMEPLLRGGAVYYREGSGALSLAYVAAGRLIGYIEAHINSWDCAGGLAIVQAAGGRTNDPIAGDGLWNGAPIAASAPGIYPILEALLPPRA